MTQPRSFLLVDDDIDDIIIFQETLRKVDDKIQSVSVHDGKDAIDFLDESNGRFTQVLFFRHQYAPYGWQGMFKTSET